MKVEITMNQGNTSTIKELSLNQLKLLIRAFESKGYKRRAVGHYSTFEAMVRASGGIPLTLNTCADFSTVEIRLTE